MHSSAARTFKVDLPNGKYSVSVTMGDNDFAHDNMVVKANGTSVLPAVSSAVGGYSVNTFSVTVSGGSLALEFSDGGGTDPTWVVNAVTITSTTASTAASVSISNFTFQPQNLQIKVGTVVTWTNNDATAHTVTSDTSIFDSGTLTSGAKFTFTFAQAGTFTYHCNIHTSMTGTITVTP